MQSIPQPPGGRLFTFEEARAYLNVSERWLRRAVDERRIEFVKLGGKTGHLRFRQSALDALIENSAVSAEARHG